MDPAGPATLLSPWAEYGISANIVIWATVITIRRARAGPRERSAELGSLLIPHHLRDGDRSRRYCLLTAMSAVRRANPVARETSLAHARARWTAAPTLAC